MDREKVIEGLTAMREFFGFGLPSQSPVFEAYQNILTDALELLKEQEEVEPLPDYNIRYWRCPNCNWLLTSMIDGGCDIPVRRDNYCARCGRAVKWE